MTIDIDRLTEAELIDLNRRVVERLRLLQQMRAHTTGRDLCTKVAEGRSVPNLDIVCRPRDEGFAY